MERSQFLSWLFFINKSNRRFIISALVITVLIGFPFLMVELYNQTRGILNLTALDRKVITPNNLQTTLKEVDEYLSSYRLNTSVLESQLDAFSQFPNPDIYLLERKIHLIKLILQRTWFPNNSLYYKLAKIYFQLGYYESSLYYLNFVKLDDITTLEEKIDIISMQYNLNSQLENFPNAILSAQKMLELTPDNYRWTYELALSYISSGEYLSARGELEKLVFDNGNHPLYLNAMFTLIEVLRILNLETKINFYYRYLATIYSQRGEEDLLLSSYAKHLMKDNPISIAVDIWKVAYGIVKDRKNINSNLKNNFNKYLNL